MNGIMVTHQALYPMREVATRFVRRERIAAAVPHASAPKRDPTFRTSVLVGEGEKMVKSAGEGIQASFVSKIPVTYRRILQYEWTVITYRKSAPVVASTRVIQV